MNVYTSWDTYYKSKQDAYLSEDNCGDCDVNTTYAGLKIYGQTNISAWEIAAETDTLAIIADAEEKDVRDYIKTHLGRQPEYYYRLNAEYPFCLCRGELSITQEMDYSSEERLMDLSGLNIDNLKWEMVDAYIHRKLGYLPKYETTLDSYQLQAAMTALN